MIPENTPITGILIVISVILVATLLICSLALKLSAFSRELGYINREIQRTSGSEREYWKRQKRRLWRSLLPFFR